MKNILVVLLLATKSFSQTGDISDAIRFYPINNDNYWEYKDFSGSVIEPYEFSYSSLIVLGDTLFSNNINYKILLRFSITENEIISRTFERVDSTTGIVYRYDVDKSIEFVIDSLLSKTNDMFQGSRLGFYDENNFMTECISEKEELIFDSLITVKEFVDRSSIFGYRYRLAKGIGLISDHACEGNCWGKDLIFAKINGHEYGNKLTYIGMQTSEQPNSYNLYQNYPNPFNPVTTISFSIPENQTVELAVYDILGTEIKQLINEYRTAGIYKEKFNANNLSSGIYYYKLKAGNFVQIKKLILLK